MESQDPERKPHGNDLRDPSRRSFLQTVAGSAAGLAAVNLAAVNAEGTRGTEKGPEGNSTPSVLPTVQLGSHRISRLIMGGNPIYGYSHFNKLYSQHLKDYHTPDRVVELLRACQQAGVNTWQNSYAPRTLEDVERCRAEGIDFKWLLLGKGSWEQEPGHVEKAARLKPIGIAPHGAHADRLHRAGKTRELRDLLKRIRQTGVLVGLSAHNPELLELAEEESWDVDYYMCCLYYLTRPREEIARILGEEPVGEVYLPSDRKRMLGVIRAASKPCLAYKVLAAGRLNLSPSGIRRSFQEVLSSIKPTDAMIVGMFQEFGNQVETNAKIVRELGQT